MTTIDITQILELARRTRHPATTPEIKITDYGRYLLVETIRGGHVVDQEKVYDMTVEEIKEYMKMC